MTTASVQRPSPTSPAEAKLFAARMKARWWPSIMTSSVMCLGCGDRTHAKANCKMVDKDTCCEYCKLKGSHTVSVCPTLHGLCKRCFRRGHFIRCDTFDEKHWYKCKPLGLQSKAEDYHLQVIPPVVKLQIFKEFGKDLPKVFAQLPTYIKEDITKEERIQYGISPLAQPLPKSSIQPKQTSTTVKSATTPKSSAPTNATPAKIAKQTVVATTYAVAKTTPSAIATPAKSAAQAAKMTSNTLAKVIPTTSSTQLKSTPPTVSASVAKTTPPTTSVPPAKSTTQTISVASTTTTTPLQTTRWSSAPSQSQPATTELTSAGSQPAGVPFLEPCVVPVKWLEYLSLDSSVCKQCAKASHANSKKCPNMTSDKWCKYCGNLNHLVAACPALHKLCKACWRRGHETGKCAKFDVELWQQCKPMGVQTCKQDAMVDVVGIKQKAIDLFGDRLCEVFWQLPLFIRERFSPDERMRLGVCAELESGARDSNTHPELELGDRCACCAVSGHLAPTCPQRTPALVCEYCGRKRHHTVAACAMLHLLCPECWRRGHRVGRCEQLDEEKWHNLKYKAFGSRNCKYSLYVDPSTLNEKMCLSQEKLRQIRNKNLKTTSAPTHIPVLPAAVAPPYPSVPMPIPMSLPSNGSLVPPPLAMAPAWPPSMMPLAEPGPLAPRPMLPTPYQHQTSHPQLLPPPGFPLTFPPLNMSGPSQSQAPFSLPAPHQMHQMLPQPMLPSPVPQHVLSFQGPPTAGPPQVTQPMPMFSWPHEQQQQHVLPQPPQVPFQLPPPHQVLPSQPQPSFPVQDPRHIVPSQAPLPSVVNSQSMAPDDHVMSLTGPPIAVFPAYSGHAHLDQAPAQSAQQGLFASSGPALVTTEVTKDSPLITEKGPDRQQLKRKAEEPAEAPRFVLPKPVPSLND